MHRISLIIPLVAFSAFVAAQPSLQFNEVTSAVGISQNRRTTKWGGPCVADLDGDGIYDLVLSFHNSASTQIYWGTPRGTFIKDRFQYWTDIHGINVAMRTARSNNRLMAINVGGARGSILRPPTMFLIKPDRTITNVTEDFGLGVGKGRGRVTLFMDLSLRSKQSSRRNHGGPDMAVVGYSDNDDFIQQHGYANFRGNFAFRRLPGFENEVEGRADAVDLDGDGTMEIISYFTPQVYKLTAPFTFRDATAQFLGDRYAYRTLTSVAELDIHNDGVFEIYLARAPKTDILLYPGNTVDPYSDVLLKRKAGRKHVDISAAAGIPSGTSSLGVTSGDFDNNGYVDLFVCLTRGPDMFLMNNGDGTFTRVNGIVPKSRGMRSDHAVAVDYDQDGRLDLMVGQGGVDSNGGPYRLMRNVLPATSKRHYLLVRVGHHPRRMSTALHATVIVKIGSQKLVRRVGSPGTAAGGPSLLDTLHFGLGRRAQVDWVAVRWTVGGRRVLRNVAADQKITFGIVS